MELKHKAAARKKARQVAKYVWQFPGATLKQIGTACGGKSYAWAAVYKRLAADLGWLERGERWTRLNGWRGFGKSVVSILSILGRQLVGCQTWGNVGWSASFWSSSG